MNDGGPAFPATFLYFDQEQAELAATGSRPGMSLRDYFAATALQVLLPKCTLKELKQDDAGNPVIQRQFWTKAAYRIADSMLTERDKPKD